MQLSEARMLPAECTGPPPQRTPLQDDKRGVQKK
jgi:hypothetical protein